MTDMKMVTEATAVNEADKLNDQICQLVAAKAEKDGLTPYQTAMFTLDLQATLAKVGMSTLGAPAPMMAAPAPAAPAPTARITAPTSEKRAALLPNPKVDLSDADREARIRDSITEDKILCLECGQPHKMLKRHLGETHDINEAEYRARWGLPSSYPIVAPSYSKRKAETARQAGFGKHARTA